jgi:hypothetical protein
MPFDTIVMDVMGPISPKSSTGKQYVLILVEQTTHWPEFIPLSKASAKSVAKALIDVFSRTGIPRVLKSDNGTHFKNQLIRGLEDLLGIAPVFSTVEHHQTAGSAERMIRVVREMLRKVIGDEPRSWEFALPFLAFSCRQIPSTVTGFSPFELLYSHDVRGPLQVLRDSWTGRLDSPPTKTSVIEYLTMTQDHLKMCLELATENAKKARQTEKTYYDKTSTERHFEPGQEVLLLRHSTENKLLARWDGPFRVLRKLSMVNYEVETEKGPKVYHINLLKLWHPRESDVHIPSVNVVLTAEPCTAGYESLSSPIDDDIDEDSGSIWRDDVSLTPEQNDQLRNLIQDFPDVFSGQLGRTHLIQHQIKLTSDKPVAPKSYKVPESLREQVREQLLQMMRDDIIEESDSPYASPIVCVRKKDGSIRICADLRGVNALTIADEYPASDMRGILEKAAGCVYITGLDLQQAFFQVELAAESRPYTAFRTPFGLYQYTVLPNGARNSSKCFQRLADLILRGAEDYAAAHVDDFIVFSKTWDEHMEHLHDILTRLRRANLTAKLSKCQFAKRSLKVLGHLIEDGVLKPDPDKINAIADYPVPKTKRQVRAFLGMGNWYNRFIPNFGNKAAPLTELTRKDKPDRVTWSEDADRAFNTIKADLTSDLLLLPPDFKRPFILRCDASGTGIGSVLAQVDAKGIERPISYASRKLLDREAKMSTVERELLCVVWSLSHFQQYTYGSKIQIYTDHNCLKWLQTMANHNPRLTRWALAIQRYDLEINYVPGKHNALADGLSQAFMEQ